MLLVAIVIAASLLFVFIYTPWHNGNETVHLEIEIRYAASWNGSYAYSSGSLSRLVHLSGIGPKNVSATFVGNVYSGISYSVAFQKDDNSSRILTVYVFSNVLGSQTHSNSSAFGVVGFGQSVIS